MGDVLLGLVLPALDTPSLRESIVIKWVAELSANTSIGSDILSSTYGCPLTEVVGWGMEGLDLRLDLPDAVGDFLVGLRDLVGEVLPTAATGFELVYLEIIEVDTYSGAGACPAMPLRTLTASSRVGLNTAHLPPPQLPVPKVTCTRLVSRDT